MGKRYENIYSDIRKAEGDRDMENAIEEMGDESVSRSIEDEAESYGMAETEIMIKSLGLDESKAGKEKTRQELKGLMDYSREISAITDKFDLLVTIEPKGENGRDMKEEFEAFYQKMKENLSLEKNLSDEEYLKMCPTFTYPGKSKIDQSEMKDAEMKLQELERRAGSLENENAKAIVSDLIKMGMSKISFYEHFEKGESDQAFEQSRNYYGDISDDLCRKANDIYKDKIEYLKNRPEKSKLEKELEDSEFNAEEIRTYFELALIKAGLKDSGYKVVIDNEISNIRVSAKTPKYDHGVVLIPADKKVSGTRMLELCAHEIGRHVTTNYYNEKNGFKGPMGEGWDTVNEGVSKRSELEIKKEVLGDSFHDYEINADPYYVMAMEKIRGEKNGEGKYENGWNYAKVFKYIYNLNLEENLCGNGYYNLEESLASAPEGEKQDLNIKLAKIKGKCEKEAINTAKRICLRTFRGFDPKSGGKYLSKDRIYFEGETELFDLENAGSIQEFEKYVRLSRVDPKFIPYLIKMGAYTYERGLKAAKDVAKTIWKDLDLPNKEVLQGKKDYELFLPYLSEFMEKYYKDELHNLYDKQNQAGGE